MPFLCTELARRLLHGAIERCRTDRPFTIDAFVLLPDHLHTIWTLPEGDADFSSRWAAIKARFTRAWLDAGGHESARTTSRLRRGARGVWQRRFWEHLIRDADDYNNHLDYIHYNPVKHGLAACPHAWPHSTFHRHVERHNYASDWLCHCHGRRIIVPDFSWANDRDME